MVDGSVIVVVIGVYVPPNPSTLLNVFLVVHALCTYSPPYILKTFLKYSVHRGSSISRDWHTDGWRYSHGLGGCCRNTPPSHIASNRYQEITSSVGEQFLDHSQDITNIEYLIDVSNSKLDDLPTIKDM